MMRRVRTLAQLTTALLGLGTAVPSLSQESQPSRAPEAPVPSLVAIPGCQVGAGLPSSSGTFTLFISDVAALRPGGWYYDNIIQMIERIWRRDGGEILVEGHRDRSDPPGSDENWARDAASRLIAFGIPHGRIWIQGSGDANPLISNALGADILHNRRVVIRFTSWGEQCRILYSIHLINWIQQNCTIRFDNANTAQCIVAFNRILEIVNLPQAPR